jgi:tetratricopeptide (TPR) repeat protein
VTKDRRPPRRRTVVAVGDEIVIREGSSWWRSESGQGVIDFAAQPLVGRTLPFVRKTARPAAPAVPEEERQAEDWYDLGCELEASSPRKAREAYNRALDLDSSHAGARVNLGRLMHEDGHPLAAANHYRLALAVNPDDAIAAFNLGVALEDLGRTSEAIAAYERAIAADPASADAHFNLAGLYEKDGKPAGAIRHLKAYRKLTQGR